MKPTQSPESCELCDSDFGDRVRLSSLAPDLDHPVAVEQREGVYPERRLEWLMQRAHP